MYPLESFFKMQHMKREYTENVSQDSRLLSSKNHGHIKITINFKEGIIQIGD